MAKGDWNIVDIHIDGAKGAALDRINKHLGLGLPRRGFWIFKESDNKYRERVREPARRYVLGETPCTL